LTAPAGNGVDRHGFAPVYLFVLAPLFVILMVQIVRPVLGNMIVVRTPEAAVNTRAQVVVGASRLCLASRSKVQKAERLESLLYALSSR
jgi:hypothetical protein